MSRREYGEVPEWSKGADCKSVGIAFDGSNPSLATNDNACVTQLVECNPSKVDVAGSTPVARSILPVTPDFWGVTMLIGVDFCSRGSGVEHSLGKGEVTSSNLVVSSIFSCHSREVFRYS